jgi:hypothetical protein
MNCATAKQRNATNRTFNRSEEHEQDFSGRSRGSDFQPIIGCTTITNTHLRASDVDGYNVKQQRPCQKAKVVQAVL